MGARLDHVRSYYEALNTGDADARRRPLHRGRDALLHAPGPARGRADDRRAHPLGRREHRRPVAHRGRDRGRRARGDRVDDDLARPASRASGAWTAAPSGSSSATAASARCAPTTTAARRTRAATCWASTTPAAATRRCERRSAGRPAATSRAAPALHRGARGAARVDPRASWPRSCAPTPPSGRTRAGSPTRCSPSWPTSASSGLKYPEEYGGEGGDYLHDAVFAEELARCGSGGLAAGHRRAHRHRHAAGVEVRHRGAEAALPGARDPRREDRRAGHHRARARAPTSPASARRPRRSTAATWSTARRRSSPTACAPTSWSPPSRRPSEGGHHGLSFLLIEQRHGGLQRLQEAGEDGLARLRHRRAGVPGRVRARGEPARRGEQGLLPDHGQLPVGAAADGARRGRLDAGA